MTFWVAVYCLTWAQPCQEPIHEALVKLAGIWWRVSPGCGQRDSKAVLWSVLECLQCVKVWMFMNYWPMCTKTRNYIFLPDVHSLPPLTYGGLLQGVTSPSPVLHVINALRFWGSAELVLRHQSVHGPPGSRFTVHVTVCLLFLHSPSAPLRSVPKAMLLHSGQSIKPCWSWLAPYLTLQCDSICHLLGTYLVSWIFTYTDIITLFFLISYSGLKCILLPPLTYQESENG